MKRFLIGALALAASLAAFPASAARVVFDYVDLNQPELTGFWTLDLSPVPSSFEVGFSFTVEGPIEGELFGSPIDRLHFFTPLFGSGVGVVIGGSQHSINTTSAVFTGPVSAPTFLPGVYTIGATSGRLTIAEAVPEPATWALMILGFGAAGAGLRRRRVAAA